MIVDGHGISNRQRSHMKGSAQGISAAFARNVSYDY